MQEFLSYISKLKKDYDLKIVDTHVHPLDVMGVKHFRDYDFNNSLQSFDYKLSLSEKLKFNKFVNAVTPFFFRFYQKMIFGEIEALYNNVAEKRFIDEMNYSLIDEIVFLPVEPWAKTLDIKSSYNNKRFLFLGSVDIHQCKLNEIENIINEYIQNIGIVGLKLHPNLQNFKPQPSHNSAEIKQKLELLYGLAEKHGLYLLFHGGKSSFTPRINEKFDDFERSADNALLKNFCDKNGDSELLGKYNIPIVIAHLGHFGLNKIDDKLVKIIINKYSNVYFDTAAVGPKLIKDFIEICGSEKIILGSDAIYNSMLNSMYFVYLAVKQAKTKENFSEILANIYSKNYFNNILKTYGKNIKSDQKY